MPGTLLGLLILGAKIRLLLPYALLLMCPELAAAHTPGGETASLLSGLAHPLSGLDHVSAMLAVGL